MSEEKENEQPSEEPKEKKDLEQQIADLTLKLNELEKKPTFVTMKMKNKGEVPPKVTKKENEAADTKYKFNAFEIFHPQFMDSSKMCKYDETAEILTMRVNVDPRHPEWQAS